MYNKRPVQYIIVHSVHFSRRFLVNADKATGPLFRIYGKAVWLRMVPPPPHSHYRGIGVFPEKLLMGRKNCVHRIILLLLSRRLDGGRCTYIRFEKWQ